MGSYERTIHDSEGTGSRFALGKSRRMPRGTADAEQNALNRKRRRCNSDRATDKDRLLKGHTGQTDLSFLGGRARDEIFRRRAPRRRAGQFTITVGIAAGRKLHQGHPGGSRRLGRPLQRTTTACAGSRPVWGNVVPFVRLLSTHCEHEFISQHRH